MKILAVTSLKVRKKTDVYTFFSLPGGIMKTLVSIVGPTAVGKTKVSISVAQHLNTEVISADARQFYRGMRIGTAAPTDVQLSLVRHHFVNEIPVTTQFSAGDFAKAALSRLETLFITHDAVVLTGGSGLFIKALLKGLDVFPSVSKEVVDQLNALYESEGIGVLQVMLHEKDRPYYELVDRSNPQRLLRALAVCISSGKRYSEFRKSASASRDFNSLLIGLHTDRKQLYARIDARVDQMMADGLLAEVMALSKYAGENALQTVGYRELFSHLRNEISLDQAVTLIKQHSRNYAKRQMTWFRKEDDITWFEPDDETGILSFIDMKLKSQ